MKKLVFLISFIFCSIVNAYTLRFIGDQVTKTGEKFNNTELGGLSGIYYDQNRQTLIAISDDRSQKSPARFYEFALNITNSSFSANATKVITLKNKDQKPFEKRTIDFEGITYMGGNLLVSSEGEINRNPQINPELYMFDLEGNYKNHIQVPEKFLIDSAKPDSRGVRNNMGFEVLASTPDGAKFFLGTEEALYQDSSITTPTFSSKVRLVVFQNNIAIHEYAYELDKVPSEPVAGLIAGETGLVDIALIDDKRFLSMERSYLPLAKKTIVKIFMCQISDQTTDVLNMNSLKNQKVTTIQKTLLLNLDEIIPKLNPNYAVIDNIEGITFGPKLANGNQTLILVSDNNFSVFQRTVFYAFEIIP